MSADIRYILLHTKEDIVTKLWLYRRLNIESNLLFFFLVYRYFKNRIPKILITITYISHLSHRTHACTLFYIYISINAAL